MLNAFINKEFQNVAFNIDRYIFVIQEHFSLSSKTVPASYDITPYQMESSSARSGHSSSVKTLPDVVVYTAITFVIAFCSFLWLILGNVFLQTLYKADVYI